MRIPTPGCTYRFTPADWRFITESLGIDERGREAIASLADDPDSVRSILDHPKLFESVVAARRAAVMSPNLFFLVLVRHTLRRIGLEDIEVADYVAVVCAEFGMPSPRRAPGAEAGPARLYHVDWVHALEGARGPERFFIHVECANQFLVLTCLFPAYLSKRAERRGAPSLNYYEQVVMDHLDAAGHHALAGEFNLQDVLIRLAAAFRPVRRAMNHSLREYLPLGA